MMRVIGSVVALLLVPLVAGAQEPEPFVVRLGVTELFPEATPTVGYQFDGKGASTLGYGWTGFDDASGVYFVPEETGSAGGRVFMHCPWQDGPGVAFAQYRLALPDTPRIRLSFETGLRPSAAKTDGVTYRVGLGGKTLFERHCTWKDFRLFEVELPADVRGVTVLRLEVDPGPARSTTDDWSLWRNVRVLAGTDRELANAKVRADVLAAARRAAEIARGEQLGRVSLLPLTPTHCTSVCPSVLRATTTSTRRDGDVFVFECAGDESITYRFEPAGGLLAGLSVAIDGKPLDPPPFWGGPRVHLDGHDYALPTRRLATDLVSADLAGTRLTCEYRFRNPETGSAATMRAVLWPEGKSLGIEIDGEPGGFGGFTMRPYGGRVVRTPFAVGGAPHWRREGVYLSAVADLMWSEATSVGSGAVDYGPLSDGRRNTMHDLLYLTVSSRYEETLANLTHKPSPFLDELASRVVLDAWGGPFAADEEWLKQMAAYGIDRLLVIKHVWQRDGYDRTYPNVMPANEKQGGDGALRSLSLAAKELGHRFCVHENFYDYYPDAEAFRPEHCALDRGGKPQRGWDRGPVAASILKPSLLMDYAREFSPEVKRRYDCDSAYHDIMPTWRVDFDGRVPDAGKIRVTHEATRALCDYDRELFGGPVVFEAADSATAGLYDGGSNHGVDTYQTPVAVAFELLKVHPRMSNHGFGYYERWLPWGYGAGWNSYVMTDRELDKYRAYQIAFGRTGFIGQQLMPHPHALVREYHLMQAFGRAYTGRRAERIRYLVDGRWVDAGTAARFRVFDALHVEYEGGQQVYVNLSSDLLEVDGQRLPEFGALTTGPRAVAWTALRAGQVCDFARYDKVTFADARSHVWQPAAQDAPIIPFVASLNHTGANEIELTVDWHVGRSLERDYLVFWHFRDSGRIASQRDFRPRKPTTEWAVGETVSTGPARIAIEADAGIAAYDLVVGLYDKQGRAVLMSGGVEAKIARIRVERKGDEAVGVEWEKSDADEAPGTRREPYLRDANTARRVIDFGGVATNGCVVLRALANAQEVVAVPIGEPMTVGVPGTDVRVEARGRQGRDVAGPKSAPRDGKLWFDTGPAAVRYVLSR